MPGIVGVDDRGDLPVIETEQRGCQRTPREIRVVKVRDREQQVVKPRGFVALEDRIAADRHRADPVAAQFARQRLPLESLAHKNRDVAAFERPLAEAEAAASAAVEQRRDLADQRAIDRFAHAFAAERFVVLVARQLPDGQGRQRLSVAPQAEGVVAGRGLDFGIVDRIAEDEGIGAAREQRVDRAHQVRLRAPVGREAVTPGRRQAARLHVGKDVAAAKTVDRLFGVADQRQAGAAVGRINALEDPVLHRVGILEFVDHRHRELAAQRRGELRAAVAVERVAQQRQLVLETESRARPLGLGHAPRRVAPGVGDQPGTDLHGEFGPGGGERVDQGKEFVLESGIATDLARFRVVPQALAREQLETVERQFAGRREICVGGGQQPFDGGGVVG